MNNNISPYYMITKIIVYLILLCIFLFYVPKINPDYQFFVKAILLSIPVIMGLQETEEISEAFQSKNTNKVNQQLMKKIIAQIVDVSNQSTIAIVYENGDVEFIQKHNNNNNDSYSYIEEEKSWYNELK